MVNKTELMAKEWLIKGGYKDNEIRKNGRQTPDFVCSDGKRYEVKFLYGNQILFYNKQIPSMKDEDMVIIFNRNQFISQFKWKDRYNQPIKIKIIILQENKTKVEIETEILNQLIKLKNVGDTYSDIIRRLLE